MEAGKHPSAWTRPLRRLFKPFLSKAELGRIAKAIAEVEAKTTGEVHVHVISHAPEDVLRAAEAKFLELRLDKTELRNGVLILISDLDHRFAVWGDKGIHEKGGHALWERAKNDLLKFFRERRYAEGVEACVREVGAELARHFPRTGGGPDVNELPDEISRS